MEGDEWSIMNTLKGKKRRVSIRVDDGLRHTIHNQASNRRLSVSSYVTYLVGQALLVIAQGDLTPLEAIVDRGLYNEEPLQFFINDSDNELIESLCEAFDLSLSELLRRLVYFTSSNESIGKGGSIING